MFLASQGINEVTIYEKPKIASFSSGDEIIEPWEKASEYEIYNANSSGIQAILKNSNFKSSYKGIIKDTYESTLNALRNSGDYDVIITSGGASKGDHDFMKECLLELGYEEIFSHINVRPGKPTGVYKKDSKLVFILPGNPMAAFLIAFLIVVPALKQISGQNISNHKKIVARFDGNINLKEQRSNLVLGVYKDGKFKTINNNKFGSGMIKPLVVANALYVSKVGESKLEDGRLLEIIMLY
ncbi:molybdopterin molybdotransferase MoeA [Campylobacter blaseri]|nr:molybdopterin molybdotransferase MoeA [Campylobacter blaseri]